MVIPGIQLNQDDKINEWNSRKKELKELKDMKEIITKTYDDIREIQNPFKGLDIKEQQRMIGQKIKELLNVLDSKVQGNNHLYYIVLSVKGEIEGFDSLPDSFERFMELLLRSESEIKNKISELEKSIGEKWIIRKKRNRKDFAFLKKYA